VPASDKPILVGLDGSDEAERGLAAARALAAKSGNSIVLLRTYSVPPPAGVEFATYPADFAQTLEMGAKEYLGSAAKPGEKTLVVMGDATTAILEAAEELDVALIVLSSSGKGLARRLTLGSTTDRVIHGTERPVLVIPREA
jgi:nucleotide-binding universal stress UspA family protein